MHRKTRYQPQLLILVLLLASTVHAGVSIITGQIKDAQGNPINGTLVMRLPQPAQDPLTQAAIANVPVTFQLVNGQVTGGAPLYDLATIQPKKLWYSARAYDTTGALVFYGNYFVTGSTFNIGAASPSTVTTSNISFSNLTTGIASINGDTTQAQTIVGSGSITASTAAGKTTIGGGGGVGISTFVGTSDAKFDTTCSTLNTSNQLTCSDAPFSVCPVGNVVSVTGGAVDGGSNVVSLITTIQSCNSSSVAVMAANSTHTVVSPGARWGTDNFPALKAQYATAAASRNTFVVPPGNYLINTPSGNFMTLTSGSELVIQKGATIHWVGPVGSPNNAEGDVVFMFVNDGTINVHVRIDGTIQGDNISGGPGVPSLNQSQLISIFNGFTGLIDNITIDGTGLIQYLYGFDVHSLATGIVNFDGLRINVSAKGTNINSPGWQTHLTLKKSFGMEAASPGMVIADNVFDASGGMSLGGAGGACPGIVVSGNSFVNTTRATNLFLGSCVTGAVITGNAFYVAGSSNTGVNVQAPDGFSTVGSNLIANNTFTCGGAFPNAGQAAITMGGINVTPGSFYYNNTVASDPAVPNSYCNYGVLENNSTSTDTFMGGYYTDSGHGLADFSIQGSGVTALLVGVQIAGNTPIANIASGGGTLAPSSTVINPSGVQYGIINTAVSAAGVNGILSNMTGATNNSNAIGAETFTATAGNLFQGFQATSAFSGAAFNATMGVSGTFTGNFFLGTNNGATKFSVDSNGSTVVAGKLNIGDKGTCTMAAGTCSAQALVATYGTAPVCYATYTGTGTLAGTIKIASTTTTVTPASTTGTDTAQVNWACLGN